MVLKKKAILAKELLIIWLFMVSTIYAAVPAGQCCRCFNISAPCWPRATDWAALNASVEGRLYNRIDPFAACVTGTNVTACSILGQQIYNNYYSADLDLIQSMGNYLMFDGITDTPRMVVLAQSVTDIVAAVDFAREYRLRLVVKNTGHDWYGRNLANPALQLFTHWMTNVQWHDTFKTCDGRILKDAVTLDAGVQWIKVVPGLMERGRFAPYGTTMSVGAAGGFFQAGGFPAVSGEFGSAADNIRQMHVVTADGDIKLLNSCNEHADLFWAICGGGGGTFGVVINVTYETYPSWENLGNTVFRLVFNTAPASVVRRKFFDFYATLDPKRWSFVYVDFSPTTIQLLGWVNTYTAKEAQQQWQPLVDWLNSKGGFIQVPLNATVWIKVRKLPITLFPKSPTTGKAYLIPDLIVDPDAQPGKYDVPPLYWSNTVGWQISKEHWEDGSFADFVNGVVFSEKGGVNYLHMDFTKALYGKHPYTNSTSLNPTVYNAIGHIYTGSISLQTYWLGFNPNLEYQYWPDEIKNCSTSKENFNITKCFYSFPEMHEHDCLAAEGATRFPNTGSYMNENDPRIPNWQNSQWGINYPVLLAIKEQYDPDGLFICHHCVGSEKYVIVEESRGFCLTNAVDKCPFFSGPDLGIIPKTPPPSFPHRILDPKALGCVFTPDPYAFTDPASYP